MLFSYDANDSNPTRGGPRDVCEASREGSGRRRDRPSLMFKPWSAVNEDGLRLIRVVSVSKHTDGDVGCSSGGVQGQG